MAAGGLRLRVHKYLGGMAVSNNAVVANIYALDSGKGKNSVRNAMIPVGPTLEYESVTLPEGRYQVEAILPSGDILSQEASVKGDDWTTVDLRGEDSAHEWHSWQNLVGNVVSSKSYYRLPESVRPAPKVWVIREPSPELRSGSPQSMNVWSFLDAIVTSGETLDVNRTLSTISEKPSLLNPTASDANSQLYTFFTGHYPSEEKPPHWYACISGEEGFELVSLPVPWFSVTGGEVPVELLIQQSADGRLNAGFSVLDGDFGTALGYMARGSLQSAMQLAARGSALEMLFMKFQNPLGAAAGGYLLIGTEVVRDEKPWHQWIRNLNKYFRWLPDGAVQEAWLWLRGGSSPENLENAFRCLREAYSRGLPYFSFGLQWMVDGLTLVSERYAEAKEMLGYVQRAAWRVNTAQPFTSLALSKPFRSRGNPFPRAESSSRGNAAQEPQLVRAR